MKGKNIFDAVTGKKQQEFWSGTMSRRSFISRACTAALLAGTGLPQSIACKEKFIDPEKLSAFVREARYYKELEGNAVRCLLCPNGCELEDGGTGICRVRKNIGGTLYTMVYGRIAAMHIDPVEKKPFYHFLPGKKALSIATAGCNLRCRFCQNWQLAQSSPDSLDARLVTPDTLSGISRDHSAPIIAYTYNEPTVQYEYVFDSAAAAKAKGLRPAIISNGYINPKAGSALAQNLDAVKIDLKAFTEKFYSEICGGSLGGVLKNLEAVYKTGTWLEIVVLVIPSLNDRPSDIKKMSRWIRRNLSRNVPVHFTRFHGMYKMKNLPSTPVSILERCRKIAMEEGIRYAYVGNVPGHPGEHTYCHRCGARCIERGGYFDIKVKLVKGKCPRCGAKIPGVWV